MSQKVRAKFVCNSVNPDAIGNQKEVKMSAVYGKGGENEDFTKITPVGELRILIQNDAPAANFFKPTKSYYLTFDEAQE